jgi:hypothetical protein
MIERRLPKTCASGLRVPNDARLWLRGKEFVTPDRVVIEKALASTGSLGRSV